MCPVYSDFDNGNSNPTLVLNSTYAITKTHLTLQEMAMVVVSQVMTDPSYHDGFNGRSQLFGAPVKAFSQPRSIHTEMTARPPHSGSCVLKLRTPRIC